MIGNLTLDQLRVLTTIAETGSFSAAGRRLNRAQSAICQAVAMLEDVQGVTLFDRSGFRPVLTEVGRVLVAQARSVLASAARFTRRHRHPNPGRHRRGRCDDPPELRGGDGRGNLKRGTRRPPGLQPPAADRATAGDCRAAAKPFRP